MFLECVAGELLIIVLFGLFCGVVFDNNLLVRLQLVQIVSTFSRINVF